MSDPRVAMLKRVPLFGGCDTRDLERIAALAEEVDFPAGKQIIGEGTFGQEFFVIVDGEIEVEREGKHLRTMGPGEFLGEISLVDHRPRSASATVTQPSRLLVLGHREFHSLISTHPAIALKVMAALAQRVRSLDPDTY
ncbi:MAG: cyclic nucleotide-binding domain-containing protein [Candidatus Limnocylindrales bacterium]